MSEESKTMTDVRNTPDHIRAVAKGLKIMIDTGEVFNIIKEAHAMALCNATEIEQLREQVRLFRGEQ